MRDLCCPVCRTQFHSRARVVDHLAHDAERCRQAIQGDPDHFPNNGACGAAKSGPTGPAGAQKGSKTWSLLAGGLLAGCTMRAPKRTLNAVVCEGQVVRVSSPPCTRKSAKVMVKNAVPKHSLPMPATPRGQQVTVFVPAVLTAPGEVFLHFLHFRPTTWRHSSQPDTCNVTITCSL